MSAPKISLPANSTIRVIESKSCLIGALLGKGRPSLSTREAWDLAGGCAVCLLVGQMGIGSSARVPEAIVIQVGQCGNQIGARFWDLVLQEHLKHQRTTTYGKKADRAHYDPSMTSFFRNADRSLSAEWGANEIKPIYELKARAVMVDMEPNVLSQIERSPLGSLFDTHQSMHPTSSGSGNNFSVGYHVYGSEYLSVVIESIRREVEACDALQTFFMLHSLGGGTGSGFGARLVESLEEIYPEAYRFSTVLCPSTRGAEDVVTSPYNAILSLHKLISAADCILPIANDALLDTISKAALQSKGFSHSRLPSSSLISNPGCTQFSAFNSMNNIVANLLANVTASMRFEGTMNIDIGDVVTNLVPFPACRFIVGGMSPIVETGNSAGLAVAGKRFDQIFSDSFANENTLVKADVKTGIFLACALAIRGPDIGISDVRRNIDRLQRSLRFASWNKQAWKTGLCAMPPATMNNSVLSLSNSTSVTQTLQSVRQRFSKLYKRKANLHHYLDNMEIGDFVDARERLDRVIEEYDAVHE